MAQIKKVKQTKETDARILTRQSLFWLATLIFIALPFLNSFVLQTMLINIDGNIAYKSVAPVLTAIRDIISVFNSYAGIGILAAAIAHFGAKKAIGTVILALLYQTVVMLASMMSYALSGARNFAGAVFMLGVDALTNTAIYAVILVVLVILRKNKMEYQDASLTLNDKIIAKGGAYSYIVTAVGIFGAAQLAAMLYSMISAFVDPSIGIPINIQEWVYWITEYLTFFIYFAIGYLIVLGVFWLCKYYLSHFEEATE